MKEKNSTDQSRGGQVSDSAYRHIMGSYERWESGLSAKAELETIEEMAGERGRQARLHHWFDALVRHKLWIEAALGSRLKRRPKRKLWHFLQVAAAEYLMEPNNLPQVVHHAVEQGRVLRFSRPELGLINAVLRQLPVAFGEPRERWVQLSHPEYLWNRWKKQMGEDGAMALMEWNQGLPRNYLYSNVAIPEMEVSRFPGFYVIESGKDWDVARELIQRGEAYIQDPATEKAVSLHSWRGDERVLDLCSAPGGKAWQILNRLEASGQLTAVDLPGFRLERLAENLKRHRSKASVKILGSDLKELRSEGELAGAFDVVFLDVPCSNTGVIRRKPDVKYRLSNADFEQLGDLQRSFLGAAASHVKPGGVLIYSTCSVEEEENAERVQHFLAKHSEFRLVSHHISYPQVTLHDGGGAFMMKKEIEPKENHS